MRRTGFLAFSLSALVVMSAAAHAGVSVDFVRPERFSDDDFRDSARRAGLVQEFDKYLRRLGERYLTDGQVLKIDVVNVSLAGRYEPWGGFRDVRVMRDITPPRFKLRYALTQGGKVLIAGEENVTDMTYLWNSAARGSSERFAYEKDMLRKWFHNRFVKLRPARS